MKKRLQKLNHKMKISQVILALTGLLLLSMFTTCHRFVPQPLQCNDELVAAELASMIGAYRLSEGLPPLIFDSSLRNVTDDFVKILAESGEVNHDLDGLSPRERLTAAGIVRFRVGENLSVVTYNSEASREILNRWLSRRQERENLTNEKFIRMGLSVYGKGRQCYTVLVLTE